MHPAVSQVGSLSSPLETDLAEYAQAGCRRIELWLGKLDQFLDRHALDDLLRLRDRHELSFPAASYQGGLLTPEGDARRAHWAAFEQRLTLCRTLGAPLLVVAGDLLGPVAAADLERACASLREAARRAEAAEVRLALEFQAQASFPNNLASALTLLDAAASPALGLCLDLFHFYKGPSKEQDLAALTAENLFHVQLSDLAGTPREFAADADRVLPGDGDFDFSPLLARLRAIGYAGSLSVEIPNPQFWQIAPRQFCETALASVRRLLEPPRSL